MKTRRWLRAEVLRAWPASLLAAFSDYNPDMPFTVQDIESARERI